MVEPAELAKGLGRLPPILDPARPATPVFLLASATVRELAAA